MDRDTRTTPQRRTLATPFVCAVIAGAALLHSPTAAHARTEAPAGLEKTVSAGDASKGSQLTVRMITDRTRMTVADRLVVTFDVQAAPGASITLPQFSDTLGDFTVASSESLPAATGSAERQLRLVLEPFLNGSKTIPALTFKATKDGQTTSVMTEPLSIPVSDVLTLEKDQTPPIAPAKPPVDFDEPARARWPVILIGSLAGAGYVGAFGLAMLNARRRRASTDPVAAFGLTLSDADQRCTVGTSAASVESALFGIAAGLRRYLSLHVRIPAIGASAPELIDRVRRAEHLSNANRAAIERLVVELESARFAPGEATPDRARQLIAQAREVLAATSAPADAPTAPIGGEVAA